jgi:dolichol kinase
MVLFAAARHAPLLLRPASQALVRIGSPPVASTATVAAATSLTASFIPPAATAAWAACSPLWARDAACAVFLVIASVVWIKICNALAGVGLTSQYLSRKLVHMGSGPLFVLFWPLFSTAPSGQLLATVVPVLSLLRLWRAGRRVPEEGSELVRAISRSGERKEALEGPFKYTIVLFLSCLLGWRSAVSVVAINQMAIGDGMADVIGRRFGSTKWPKAIEPSGKKSVEGTVAFAFFAFFACYASLALFFWAGLVAVSPASSISALLIISAVSALAELLPLGDDNLTVPLSAALMRAFLLR